MNLLNKDLNTLLTMTDTEKINFLFNGIEDSGRSCEYALLLGSYFDEAEKRALYAARLYKEGRIKYIIPSGGVVRNYLGEDISECDFMARILMENGVPASAIIAENNANTTVENMIFGTLMLYRMTELIGINEVMIITSAWHMKRSLALAKCFFPRKISPICGPVPLPCSAEQWIESKENLNRVNIEIKLIKGLADNKIYL